LVEESVKHRILLLQSLAAAGGRYALRTAKNFIKLLMGRKAFFNEEGLFFRQYFLHLTGLRPIRRVTCTGLPGEGVASQALTIMSTINFARMSGLTYVHTPFSVIHHAERPMKEWAAAWESFFNLGAGEIVSDVRQSEAVNSCYNFNDLELCFGWQGRGDELSRGFRAMVPEFKRKFYLNKSPRTTEEVTVAVHIRRGDVSAERNAHSFTDTETILRRIHAVKLILDAHAVNYRIRVYSQGERADFPELSLPGIELFIDVDGVWTMEELIEADILIMAKSCFSFLAALYSDGIKISEPWEDSRPMEGCIRCLAHGSLDRAAFESQLFQLLQAKAMAANKESIDSRM
jgi:hypothetical protein